MRVIVVSPTPGPVSALLAGPVLSAAGAWLLEVGNQLALDDERGLGSTLAAAVRFVPRAARLGLGAGVPVALAVVAWQVWDGTGATVWLLPAVLSASVAVVAVLLLVTMLPLAAQLRDRTDRQLYRVAVELLTCRPLPCLGTLVLAAAGLWLATTWSASVLPLVPGPVVVALCAGTWTSAVDLGLVRLTPPSVDGQWATARSRRPSRVPGTAQKSIATSRRHVLAAVLWRRGRVELVRSDTRGAGSASCALGHGPQTAEGPRLPGGRGGTSREVQRRIYGSLVQRTGGRGGGHDEIRQQLDLLDEGLIDEPHLERVRTHRSPPRDVTEPPPCGTSSGVVPGYEPWTKRRSGSL